MDYLQSYVCESGSVNMLINVLVPNRKHCHAQTEENSSSEDAT